MLLLLCLPLGAAVGLMAGLFGIGGGALLVPCLSFLFVWQGMGSDAALHAALATSMTSIVLISWKSMRQHQQRGAVRWDIWRTMSPGVVLGACVGAWLVPQVDGRWLAWFFAVFLCYVAVQMMRPMSQSQSTSLWKPVGLMGAGGGIGLMSALLSIGGGTMTVPFLTWQSLSIRQAIGTSAALGLPISLSASLAYLVFSSPVVTDSAVASLVNLPVVAVLSLSSFWTVGYGVALAQKLEMQTLKRLFALLLLLLAGQMLWLLG